MSANASPILWVGILLLALMSGESLLAADAQPADPAKVEFFETKVRPLLAERCFKCHGQKKQESDVRLDRRKLVLGGSEGDPLVIPGKPDESRIMQVLAYKPFDIQMPPDGPLPKKEIAILSAWIADGAIWPASDEADEPSAVANAAEPHWAFEPMSNPTPPPLVHEKRVNNAIDRFLLARLEQEGLTFSPRADRRTLLRRAYLDLIGIPPTPEQMGAFLADDSPNAYEEMIDRLLASPLYGQRWARHWLDVARYADTKGYVFQEDINYPYAYTYRDYVVKAFNADKPYDRFIVEQLAADLLELPPHAPELAALGFLTVGRRNLNSRPDIIDDRIDVTCRGLMGLTVACARCHDHKFDPIPTADYYSLYGVFDSTYEPEVNELPLIGSADKTKAYKRFQAELAKRREALTAYRTGVRATIEKKMRTSSADYLRALQADAKTFEGARAPMIPLWNKTLKKAGTSDPVFGLWNRMSAVPLEKFAASYKKEIAALQTVKAFQSGVGLFVLDRLAGESISSPDALASAYGKLLAATATPPKKLSQEEAAQFQALDQHLRKLGDPFAIPDSLLERVWTTAERNHSRGLKKKVDSLLAESDVSPPRAMVVLDKETPVNPVIFERGSASRRGDAVPRQFLKVLCDGKRKPFPKDASGRLQLARLIASPDNPLTARVYVNRLWQHHFGKGLVRTPSNFGTQGKPPTHLRLLDWLAQEFIQRGWSIKELHRLVMNSSAYQQASVNRSVENPRLMKIDPTNQLLWRMNPRRLGFEAMRDATLSVAGQLNPALGGRAIKLFAEKSHRRTIYGYVNRNDMPAVRRTFDFPASARSIGERPQTTVPQQALFGMNSPFMIAQARALAEQSEITSAKTPQERVQRLFQQVLQRKPRETEARAAVSFLTAELAPKVEKTGLSRVGQLAQVLLLSNEFIFIE